MPRPKKGEKRSDYLKRAIPEIMGEGMRQNAAVGKAEGMFTHYKKKGFGVGKK